MGRAALRVGARVRGLFRPRVCGLPAQPKPRGLLAEVAGWRRGAMSHPIVMMGAMTTQLLLDLVVPPKRRVSPAAGGARVPRPVVVDRSAGGAIAGPDIGRGSAARRGAGAASSAGGRSRGSVSRRASGRHVVDGGTEGRPPAPSDLWRLDEHTREVGRRGIEEARRVLAQIGGSGTAA